MTIKKKLEKDIIRLDQTIGAAYSKTKAMAQSIRELQNAELEQVIAVSRDNEINVSSAADKYLTGIQAQFQDTVLRALAGAGLEVLPWSAPLWGNLWLPVKKTPPEYVRIGELVTSDLLRTPLPPIPALLPLIKSNHVLTFFSRPLVEDGARLLSSIVWRILSSASPETFRLIFIDPIGRGRSFASFHSLPAAIRDDRIYCQNKEIEEVLDRSVKEMIDIIQHRLRKPGISIEEYNASNPTTAIPYHFVIFTAFPEGYSDQAVDSLVAIAQSGVQAGFYLVGGVFQDHAPINETNRKDLSRLVEHSSCLSIEQSGRAIWDDPVFAHLPVLLDPPPSNELAELIAFLTQESLNQYSSVIDFSSIAPKNFEWMKLSSRAGLVAPVGIGEDGEIFNIELGPESDTFNGIIGGRIHSGKSNFLHVLILSLCQRYSADDLELYLVDFKEGVEFQDYAIDPPPQVKAVVIEAEREFGLSILDFLVEEMKRRSEAFKAQGINARKIEEFPMSADKPMPRIVVIFDEFVKLFEEDDTICDRAYEQLEQVALRGRAFGIHLLLAAQRPVGNFKNLNPIKSQVGLRIGFKVNEPDDSSLILGERNEKAAYLEHNGIACITYSPTIPKNTTEVKIAYVEQDDRKHYLEAIRNLAQERSFGSFRKPIVFNKSKPAYWIENSDIIEHIKHGVSSTGPLIALGQPVRLAEDRAISITRQESENILLLGSNDRLAFQTLIHSLISIALTCHPDRVELYWLSASNSFPNASEYLEKLRNILPCSVEIGVRGSAQTILDELLQRMDHRMSQENEATLTFLFVPGMHRITEFRDTELSETPKLGEMMSKLLQDGPTRGMHSILWADRYETIRNNLSFTSIDYFNHRIAYHMSLEDSNSILGVSDASRLGTDKRFLYRNQLWAERAVDKVKPYDLPSIDEFEKVVQLIRNRWE